MTISCQTKHMICIEEGPMKDHIYIFGYISYILILYK